MLMSNFVLIMDKKIGSFVRMLLLLLLAVQGGLAAFAHQVIHFLQFCTFVTIII